MTGLDTASRAERVAASKAIRALRCPRCDAGLLPAAGSAYTAAVCVRTGCASSYVPMPVTLGPFDGTSIVAALADEQLEQPYATGVLVTAADLDRIGARFGTPRLAGSGARVRTERGLSARTYRTWFVDVDGTLVNHFVSVDEYAGGGGRGGTLWVVEVGSHGILGHITWSTRTPPSPRDVARLAALVWGPA